MRVSRTIPLQAEAPVALTVGNFDGVHLGHQAMLARLQEAARRLGLVSCVMTFEPHPREFFAPDQAPTRLTSLREKLIKIGAKDVRYAGYAVFQMAEVAVPKQLFEEILRLIAGLRPRPAPAQGRA